MDLGVFFCPPIRGNGERNARKHEQCLKFANFFFYAVCNVEDIRTILFFINGGMLLHFVAFIWEF